jgi:hypothetical protein
MLTSKRVEGEVEYNDGEFAEVLTFGIVRNRQGPFARNDPVPP